MILPTRRSLILRTGTRPVIPQTVWFHGLRRGVRPRILLTTMSLVSGGGEDNHLPYCLVCAVRRG